MNNPQTAAAINTIDRLLYLLDDAERQFKSARNWSVIDILGGGFFTDLIKHYKLGKASDTMDEVNYLMQELGRQLGSINIPDNYRMHLGGFLTFADFFFDGIFVDAYMASKIFSSIDEIKKLRNKLTGLRSNLQQM